MTAEAQISAQIPDLLPRIRAVVAARGPGLDVDDMTQECCVRIIEKEGLYNPQKGPLPAWIDALVRKLSMSVARREARRREIDATLPVPEASPSPFSEEQVSWILAQMSVLPAPLKDVLRMRYYEDRTLEDIGQALEISQPAASKRLKKALSELTQRARFQGLLMSFLPFSWSFKIAGASKMKIATVTGLMAAGLTTACGFFLPSDDVHLLANTSELRSTTMADTLEAPLDPNKNTIWVATTQLAWNHLKKQVGGDLLLEGKPPAADRLNGGRDPSPDIDPAAYVVGGGRREDLEKVQETLEKTFGRGRDPILDEAVDKLEAGLFSYAFLAKDLAFKTPFDILEEHPIRFVSKDASYDLETFGIEKYEPRYPRHKELAGQLKVHDYVDSNPGIRHPEFIVSLHPMQEDEIILALISPQNTLGKTVEEVLKRVGNSPATELQPGLSFKAPKMDFHLTHEFKELSRNLINAGYERDSLSNFQTVAFKFDEKGVVLRARTWLELAEKKERPMGHLIFNKPFLLLLKEKKATHPYFAMWVANPEILIPQ